MANDNTFELSADEFRQRTERIISVINNINLRGGIVTQLMMAAACIEAYGYSRYLVYLVKKLRMESNFSENTFLSRSDIWVYISRLKETLYNIRNSDDKHTLSLDSYAKARKEEIQIIEELKEEIFREDNIRVNPFSDECGKLDSWAEIRTDIDTFMCLLSDIINNIVVTALEYISFKFLDTGNTAEANSPQNLKEKESIESRAGKTIHYHFGNVNGDIALEKNVQHEEHNTENTEKNYPFDVPRSYDGQEVW